MSVNLAKYKEPLLAAWKDVLDDKTQTDWALFGYEGQTNDLKVVSKGSGGIEELVDDLNSGKIMYAFCKVIDPKTSLPKNVLINWQGEGAPVVRKGTCANHIRDIGNFFKGAHVTLHARNEEEVDTQIIIDKVSKSGSAYKFNERVESETGAGPVGTAYKRVIPKQEIDSKERDKFWEKEEQEEKQRQIEEQKRRIAESSKLDDERKQRELNEAALREAKIQVRSQSISQQREAEKQANVQKADVSVDESTGDDERKGRSDVLRRQRSQEAQSVISKRNFDARAVFEQNTSAGQLHQLRRTSSNQPTAAAQSAPLSPGKKASWPPAGVDADPPSPSNGAARPAVEASYSSVGKSVTYPGNGTSSPTHASSPADAYSLTSRNVADYDRSPSVPIAEAVKNGGPVKKVAFEEAVVEDRYEPVAFVGGTKAVPFIPEPEREWQAGVDDDGLDYNGLDLNEPGLQARALYDYQAADATELTFDPGDVITHIDQIDEGWWQGLGPDGTFGLFPANYVELIE